MKEPSKREWIAYRGRAFTIEWYWNAQERSPALEYFEALNEDRQDSLLMLLKRMGDLGKIFDKTKFRNEGDQIFAFKPQPDRFLGFSAAGRKIIITHGFVKKSDKLPPGEKDRALRAMADYVARVKKGKYYETDKANLDI
jgi:phage-related protein